MQEQANVNDCFLLVHTMTITEIDYVVQAQFFHAFSRDLSNPRLLGKRMRLKIHPALRGGRNKAGIRRQSLPNLKVLMKRNPSNVRHHLRAVHIPPIQNNQLVPRQEDRIVSISNQILPHSPIGKSFADNQEAPLSNNIVSPTSNQLTQHSSPQETIHWLSANRFEKYIETFERFSGDDMLRMSREDLIQICGDADGIRLHNAIHMKAIAPKLKIYICRENSSVYNAVFLSSHNNSELLQKLSSMIGVARERVRDIYVEGPQSIHVQLNDDLLRHIKEETMFSLQVMQENNGYILLLKRAVN